MISLLVLTLGQLLWAAYPVHWSTAYEVTETHEFYQPNEIVNKPADAWQLLFAITYPGRDVRPIKDCLFYKVPGETAGSLKLKTIPGDEQCEPHLLAPAERSWPDIKALQFAIEADKITMHLTYPGYRTERWQIQLINKSTPAFPQKLMSSAEFKSAKLIYLSNRLVAGGSSGALKKDGDICHQVKDDCQSIGANECQQCSSGWYEIPNGCSSGPKYCGILSCGRKNQAACRRGMRYQRQRKKFDCRLDSSFAYCASGLKVHCEGSQAYCR